MIYYFSATGNNQYVAERIAETLGDKACSIVGADLQVSLSEGEALGIVAPTNMYEMPVLVREFIAGMQVSLSRDNYLFYVPPTALRLDAVARMPVGPSSGAACASMPRSA